MNKNIKKILIALCCTAFSAFLAVGLAGCSKTLPQWIREQQCGEHEWNDGEVTKAATCTEEGESLFTCETCGATETQAIAMLPHNEKEVAETPSTCTAVGYTDGVQCVDCQAWVVGHEVIPMKEHDVVVQSAVEATCLTKGKTEGSYCATCETVFEEQEEIAALGHQIVVKAGYAATCTVDGMTQGQECTRCGKVYLEQEVIEATGHSLQKVEGYAATCTSNGLTDGEKCVKCGEFTIPQEVIKSAGHTEQKLEGYAATCTSNGLTDGSRCTTCGKTLVAQTKISAFGHRAKVLPAVAATCTESGLTSGEECLQCGITLKAQETVESTGHTIVRVEGSAGTCTESGLTDGQKCAKCGTILVEQVEIPTSSHVDENGDGRCETCGLTKKEAAKEVDVIDGEKIAGNWYRIYRPTTKDYVTFNLTNAPISFEYSENIILMASSGKDEYSNRLGYIYSAGPMGSTLNGMQSVIGDKYIDVYLEAGVYTYGTGDTTAEITAESTISLGNDGSYIKRLDLETNWVTKEVDVIDGEKVAGNWYRIYRPAQPSIEGSVDTVEFQLSNAPVTTWDFSTNLKLMANSLGDNRKGYVYGPGPMGYTLDGIDSVITDEYIDIYLEAGSYEILDLYGQGMDVIVEITEETTISLGNYSSYIKRLNIDANLVAE